MKQTCLFDSETASHRGHAKRWLELAEETQQELVTLLVQLVIAMQPSSNTEEKSDGRDDQ